MLGIGGRRRMVGWAWGSTDGGAWLTIAGSALEPAVLAVDMDHAVPPAPIIGSPQILARVRRCGTYFRIEGVAPEWRQHRLITATNGRCPELVTGWCTCSTWRYEAGGSVFAAGWRYPGAAYPIAVETRYEREHGHLVEDMAARAGAR